MIWITELELGVFIIWLVCVWQIRQAALAWRRLDKRKRKAKL